MAEGEVSRYRVLLASTLTGEVLGHFPAPRLQIGKKLNQPDSFELSVPYNLKRSYTRGISYKDQVLSLNPVGYWRLGESEGATTAIDSSDNGYDGTYEGNPALGVDGAIADDADTAVHFDGGARGDIPPFLSNLGAVSLETWFYRDVLETGPLLEFDGTGGRNSGVHIWNHNAGDKIFVNFVGVDAIGSTVMSATGAVEAGKWHHVVATFDGSIGRLYLDGAEVGSTSPSATILDTSGTLFFAHRPGSTYSNVRLDEVVVHDRMLTANEVKRNYDIGVQDPKFEKVTTTVQRSQIEPVATSAYIFRDGTLLGGGIIWGARLWTHDHRLVLNGEGFWSYFQKRILHVDKVYSSIDHLAFVRELIDYAQGVPGGDIQVITGTETSGIDSQATYYGHEKHNIGHIVELRTERQSPRGFDFDIVLKHEPDDTVTRNFELYYPYRGRRTGHVFELRRNIDQLQLQIDGSRKANSITGIGEGEGKDMLHATISDSNQFSAFPLLERKISHKDVKRLSTLSEHMRTELSLRSKSIEIPSLDLVTTAPQGEPGQIVPGDSVRIVADDGPLQLDKFFRLVGWSLRVENGGRENYSMEFFEEGPGL